VSPSQPEAWQLLLLRLFLDQGLLQQVSLLLRSVVRLEV
jgi:hypothetical protein